MKKGLIFLLGIISFFGINKVSAEEKHLEYNTNVNLVKPYIEEIGYEAINNAINKNIEYYNNHLSPEYPYFFISLSVVGDPSNMTDKFHVVLTALDSINYDYFPTYFRQSFDSYYSLVHGSFSNFKQIHFDFSSNEILSTDINYGYSYLYLFKFNSSGSFFNPYNYYYSNFDLYYKGSMFSSETDVGSWALTYLNPDDILYVPKLDNSSSYVFHKANEDFLIEPFYLFDSNSDLSVDNYTTINLNDYSYVILSLKSYTPRDTSSIMYVKGQLCATTVYNYGSEEKKDYVSGYQTQGCGYYYTDFTRFTSYIKSEDVTNHAVYYLTGYDSSKPNLVKVDSSVYDITYISIENENEPSILIDGKNYSVLPYSSLTDSATLTEKNGFNNTWSCAKNDPDCYLNSSGIDINNLFSNPFEALKTVWSAIVSIFMLITEFILLLPPVMQAFLILAFSVGIALGLIKILL